MATTHPSPMSSTESLPKSASPSGSETASLVNEDALALLSQGFDQGGILARNSSLAFLPVELDVAVPVRTFIVRNLLALEAGQVIETRWAHGEDMPLAARDTQLAWSEFEVVESKLAVRITRLA
jgi:flagellar motor switch protein FliN/FliY